LWRVTMETGLTTEQVLDGVTTGELGVASGSGSDSVELVGVAGPAKCKADWKSNHYLITTYLLSINHSFTSLPQIPVVPAHRKGAAKPSNRRPNNTPVIKPLPSQLIPYTSSYHPTATHSTAT